MHQSILALTFVFSAATAAPIVARDSYPTTAALNCRSGPSTSHGVERSYQSGEQITLSCQTRGESINGDTTWAKTSDGCYVADYYVSTGTSDFVVDKCGGGDGSSSGSGDSYPTTSALNCRSGASTSHGVEKTYSSGETITLSCQLKGESINGDTTWAKTSDGCYVADYYVSTGTSDFVVKKCSSGGGGGGDDDGGSGGSSSVGGAISRDEIIKRGEYWINQHIPYSMNAYQPGPEGKSYRTDCSGFVSMALHAKESYSTVSLPEIATKISWDDLQPGDLVGTLGSGTGGAAGHVTLFHSWANDAKSRYNSLECEGGAGCVPDAHDVPWSDHGHTAEPYRYNHVK